MNRLLHTTLQTLLHYRPKHLTPTQENGTACILCGNEFPRPHPDHRTPWTCLGLPSRHRHYACTHACTVVTIDDTETLFRAALPTRRAIRLYHLGTDDVPHRTGPDGDDLPDETYLAAIAAQPRQRVAITHRHGTLTTAPLPADYATQIRDQAVRLGYTARLTPAGSTR